VGNKGLCCISYVESCNPKNMIQSITLRDLGPNLNTLKVPLVSIYIILNG
jgi:hypothetical protein